ncbi:MAG: ABC transporter ATP-binding protein [Rhodobacteraceae bacterium]|nr:ABC transporter ATP-binding protein [Paracoccaceae bacterium]
MSLLEIFQLNASYGAIQALYDINLDVREGEVVALMGRNGMGKSTTVKSICRLIPSHGEMHFAGHDLQVLPSHRAAQLGIGLVPEGRRCFHSLSVYENLISAHRSGFWNFRKVIKLFPKLGERRAQKAISLSGGEQQMLAIGRALMTNPKLLILDEATEGLAPLIRQEIWAVISKLKDQTGLSILVIDKSINELKAVCDRVFIVERGKTVWKGSAAQISTKVVEDFLGV